ncbi:carbohydrate deacetylase [Brevibacillus choshinensis]|uniref:ChbG/HpnK family deacetylase n=1 Tax=Brevibacillus choshinensis TaxID=54911 RepID=A0ABX7FJ22_BRECH|nr:ChbG/HpnK family deacetylase [Brevibacillus choshinensis]QRG66223.1 ChbG/HpnK family deacetylase [Brevibacillus choshinensis]
MKIIINADDFGMSTTTDDAIIQTFSIGALTSTTIFANGATFEAACQRAHEEKLQHQVGLHINLNDGLPLSEAIRKCPRFCDENGFFRPRTRSLSRLILPLTANEKSALATELRSQIRRCRLHGLPLTHADSHNHIHTEIILGTLIMEVLKEEEIPYLRLTRNIGTDMSVPKKLYKTLYNGILSSKGLRGVQYFGEFEGMIALCQNGGNRTGSVEIMCHPIYNENGHIYDLYGASITQQFKELLDLIPGMELTTYGQMKLAG